MNPKDAGFFQKNVEKLILGVSVLLMLGGVYYFVLGNPFPVELGGSAVGPDEIRPRIESRVKRLESKLRSDETVLPDRPIPSYSEAFVEAMQDKPTTMTQLAPLALGGLSDDIVPEDTELPVYDVPRPPVAENILTRRGHAVLSDNIPTRQMQDLLRLVGNREPKDFKYVSVAATFDMDEWIKRLQSGDKDHRIPPRWWNSMIGVAGVFLQRQELNEETGEWGNEVLVGPIPGQLAFKPDEKFPATNQQAKEAIQIIRLNQEKIARPPFPQTSGNVLWSPPSEDAKELDAEGQRKLARLNSQITTTQEQIQRLLEQIQKEAEAEARKQAIEAQRSSRQGERTPRTSRRSSAGRMPPGGAPSDLNAYGADMGGAPGRAGRSRPDAAARGQATAETPQERLTLLQQKLMDLRRQRDELLGLQPDALSMSGYGMPTMGMDMGYPGMGPGGMPPDMGAYGMPGDYGPPPGMMGGGGYPGMDMGTYGGGVSPYGGMNPYGSPGGLGVPGQDETGIPQSRKIKVWAHDLSVEPGKTYRYRVVVAVLNPLYRQKRVAEEQREQYYDVIALGPDSDELAASPWSEPVQVDHEFYFFLVKGSSQSARVEVWRVYNGKWINEVFDVRPGDPIGKTVQVTIDNRTVELDMNVGKIVVDLTQIATGGGGIGRSDIRMLFLDPKANKIAQRSIEEDRNNPDWVRLKNEQALEAELAMSATSPANTLGAPVPGF
ncbi:MAG: hypothetical protein Kow00105_12350 [Phycisphaeraceae bacterium]